MPTFVSSARGFQPPPPRQGPADGVKRDLAGLPLDDLGEPVRITHGRPPEEWSDAEVRDALLWRLGPRFRAGLKPPPGSTSYYIPSPGDVSRFDPATGRWVPKTPW
ncbi:MAG: hypothetical protein QJR12_09495 [Mycobacterium sp.]|uniref:hypothetical protein n=1 Tax=Mycobacterium sp. TaxID=1785 RepID=UPI00260D5001|nr:hypothetical protein [Mycobacterium sp.]MDI3314494.1 hypothetical protein [Mycobacterium sp.]